VSALRGTEGKAKGMRFEAREKIWGGLMVRYERKTDARIGVSLDIENYCTLRLFFVPLSYVKLDHFDRQL
jgi:hypothetical protein